MLVVLKTKIAYATQQLQTMRLLKSTKRPYSAETTTREAVTRDNESAVLREVKGRNNVELRLVDDAFSVVCHAINDIEIINMVVEALEDRRRWRETSSYNEGGDRGLSSFWTHIDRGKGSP
uniref:Reverse transcriptase n=1 Tax=Ascaris lumbricoides TaxID=6252 RepID=A0A0M3IJ06_ASCLU